MSASLESCCSNGKMSWTPIFDVYSNSDVSCDVILQHEWTRCGGTRSVYVVDHNLSVFVEVVQMIHKTLKINLNVNQKCFCQYFD